jgi:hypothetical protein
MEAASPSVSAEWTFHALFGLGAMKEQIAAMLAGTPIVDSLGRVLGAERRPRSCYAKET